MDSGRGTAADVEAVIRTVPAADGGRSSAFFSGYRPNHGFEHVEWLVDAVHEYPDGGELNPGASGRALLRFLRPEVHERRLFVGMEFTVQEGVRVVGRGVITRVLNRKLERDA